MDIKKLHSKTWKLEVGWIDMLTVTCDMLPAQKVPFLLNVVSFGCTFISLLF